MESLNISNKNLSYPIAIFILLLTISLTFAYGTNDPDVFGHTTSEIEGGTKTCTSASSNSGDSIGSTIQASLLNGGRNICQGPNGCKIFLTSLRNSDNVPIEINSGSGIYIQQSSGRFYADIFGPNAGINGFATNLIGSLSGGCQLRTSTSMDELTITDNDGSRYCKVTICSRE